MQKQSQARQPLAALADRPSAQVLVVGGGINGIATFRDLAMQGVDVALVERGDWISGASAASSHMIHGGIRYLENGEARLVRESVHERNGLLAIAPHHVKPLETTVPIFHTFAGLVAAPMRFVTHRAGRPSERGAVLIKAGLLMYDAFSRAGGSVPRHRFRLRKAALADLPALRKDVRYTATYFDASVHDPERLGLDVLKDGIEAGGRAANRVAAVGIDDGGVLLEDAETGTRFVFRADVVVNATGPWTDLTNTAFGSSTTYMGGTKGSHIVLDSSDLLAATRGRELFFEHSDGRIVLIYPLKGRVLVGTTDIDADPSVPARCTEDEIDYFFDLIGHVFPDVRVDREQIVFRFAGIRPLPRHDDLAPGFVSRDYRIVRTEVPGLTGTVLSLVGGKWTTFRALAEHLTDDVLARLGATRTSSTAGVAIGGGRGFPTGPDAREHWIRIHDGVPALRASVLLDRYGTRAAEVIGSLPGDDRQLASAALSTGEMRYLIEREQALHIEDVVLRRTDLAFTGAVTADALAEIAGAMADVLGWSAATVAAEIERAERVLADEHGVHVASGVAA